MNKLIKIEKATCEGEFVGYRISVCEARSISDLDGWIVLVFADQNVFPGFRHGTHFVSNKDKVVEYEEQNIVDAEVYCR